MARRGMIDFNRLAGADMRWRYAKKYPYGEGRPGSRKLMDAFYNKLVRAFVDLWVLSGLGPADRIVSAGAWVPKSDERGPNDRHVQGVAIDIDAIHWDHTSLIAHPDHSEIDFYLGVEAHFRCYFHTVLGASYDSRHKGHFHIDDGQKLRPAKISSKMHRKFLQSVLKYVWHVEGKPYYKGKVDGIWGTKSANAMDDLQEHLQLNKNMSRDLATWGKFLQLTAIQGMRVQ